MQVNLRELKPNPTRDFTIDPIDDAKVAELKDSIRDDGFWGGVVCRRVNGHIEIAAGHHRVQAALGVGIRSADLFVAEDLDDAGMVRVYARENATQRGNSSTAIAGTVAAAIRVLAKAYLTGVGFSRNRENPTKDEIATVRGNLASDRGLGEPVIVSFLDGVPGVGSHVVKQQLANLKASGDYARIIAEIREQIERENREALKALEQAERERAAAETKAAAAEAKRKEAAAKAKAAKEDAERKRTEVERQRAEAEAKLAAERQAEAERELEQFEALRQTRDDARAAAENSAAREKTFDFEGVAAHLHTASHIDVFRELATSPGVRPYLPVNKQAALAKQLVAHVRQTSDEKRGQRGKALELTGAFIREHFMTLLMQTKHAERQMNAADRRAAENQDRTLKARQYQNDFLRACGMVAAQAKKLDEQLQKWPKGQPYPIVGSFRSTLQTTIAVLTKLEAKL